MKATKYNMTIAVEGLSQEIVTHMVQKAIAEMNQGSPEGYINMADGDCVGWSTIKKEVEI